MKTIMTAQFQNMQRKQQPFSGTLLDYSNIESV